MTPASLAQWFTFLTPEMVLPSSSSSELTVTLEMWATVLLTIVIGGWVLHQLWKVMDLIGNTVRAIVTTILSNILAIAIAKLMSMYADCLNDDMKMKECEAFNAELYDHGRSVFALGQTLLGWTMAVVDTINNTTVAKMQNS